MQSLDTHLVCKHDTFCMMKPRRKKKTLGANENFMAQCLHSNPVQLFHLDSPPSKNNHVLGEEKVWKHFFSPSFFLLHSVSNTHTVTLWSLTISHKWNEASLYSPIFLTKSFRLSCPITYCSNTQQIRKGFVICSVSKELCMTNSDAIWCYKQERWGFSARHLCLSFLISQQFVVKSHVLTLDRKAESIPNKWKVG